MATNYIYTNAQLFQQLVDALADQENFISTAIASSAVLSAAQLTYLKNALGDMLGEGLVPGALESVSQIIAAGGAKGLSAAQLKVLQTGLADTSGQLAAAINAGTNFAVPFVPGE